MWFTLTFRIELDFFCLVFVLGEKKKYLQYIVGQPHRTQAIYIDHYFIADCYSDYHLPQHSIGMRLLHWVKSHQCKYAINPFPPLTPDPLRGSKFWEAEVNIRVMLPLWLAFTEAPWTESPRSEVCISNFPVTACDCAGSTQGVYSRHRKLLHKAAYMQPFTITINPPMRHVGGKRLR